MVTVPLFDAKKQNESLDAELHAAFTRVLRSGAYILGEDVAAFEKEIAALTGAKHAIGVSSGTDAILLALMSLGLKPGDEVLCPAFTFFATAGCVSRLGGIPVFVDVGEDFCIDPKDTEKKITPRTKGIIPVALYGQSAPMNPIMEIAEKHGLWVIEDAAQSLGARYKNHGVGAIGQFGAYSFFPTKNLGGFGDAGMLVTQDDKLADQARLLRVHGSRPRYYHHCVGANFRIDTLQAALLRVKLPHLESYAQKRSHNAAYYTKGLQANLPGATQDPQTATQLILPKQSPDCHHVWNQYTLRVLGQGRRDALKKHLESHGIGSEIYYPLSLDQQPCFQGISITHGIEYAHRLTGECLSLPIFPELERPQQDAVISALVEFFKIHP